MKRVSIIYWSNGGNVEVLADRIGKGAKSKGAEVIIKQVSDAKIEDVMNADAVAFGSPSMDGNQIEQHEMAPFIKEFKMLPVNGKKTLLFGSYGWDEGEFMRKWMETMQDYDFNVYENLTIKESPNNEELIKAEKLGEKLAE